jgi:hypothetical protein
MFVIESGDELVEFIKSFTGSTNTEEIKQCIFMAEMSMRNIELPALRCDPYDPINIGVADEHGRIPIPGDMNKPILFFKQGNGNDQAQNTSQTGPWIVYDRIGDRDIITQGMIAQLYLQPVNVPAVIRGKFSEVADKYQFLPYIGEGDLINMYYYRSWALLFSPADDVLISETGTVSATSGSGPWTATLTVPSTEGLGLKAGDQIFATDGTGSLGTGGVYTIVTITSTTIDFTATGGTTPIDGDVTGIYLTGQEIATNQVLATWPEGYVYATLREYYIKRHNESDAAMYDGKFKEAWNVVEDQNNLGKWSGGHTRLTSVWQPRQYRQYNIK